jgi:DNA processing protein
VVGTRRATPYGKKVAEWLSSGLASAGVEIVSGMAYGIDSAAHKGAIAASGRTTAVLGTSIESALGGHAASIAGLILDAGGALVSEHSAETVVLKGFFAARNRIVSGMSRATVVVEAPEKSGALITATCALDHGREVMAVPGTVFSATYAGCHALIRDGATLVRSSADVLLALGYGEARPPAPGDTVTVVPDDPDATAFASLGPDAKSFEDLLESTGLDPVVLATSLGMLEIRGLARRTAAGRFERTT